MIIGAHAIIFTPDADQARTFLRDALGLTHVDSGGGWLIFALPPAELAVHPGSDAHHEVYLMCDDIDATILDLTAKGAAFGPIHEERWGRLAVMTIPGGADLPIYQPLHVSPVHHDHD